jgi:hypothetical protein
MSGADSRDQLDSKVAEEYRVAEKRFHLLAADVHLPQLDTQLFTKYFLKQKSPQRLESLKEIVEKLEAHKLATLRILKAIQERETIVQTILTTAEGFGSRKITTLEAQTTVLQQLYRHQQITLAIVEGIFAWRNTLTRPYPFQYKGRNYLRKILEDCQFLDSCQLKTILPLRVGQFPLCSNISALKMFGEKKAAGVAGDDQKKTTWGVTNPTKGAPFKSPRKNTPASQIPPNDADQSARLRAAESLLFAEHTLQVRVMRELLALANKRQFVTLLNTLDVVPNCATGILVSDPQWEAPLREWMQTALQRAEHDGIDTTTSSSSPRRNQSAANTSTSPAQSPARQVATPPRSVSPASSQSSRRSNSAASSQASTPRVHSARSQDERNTEQHAQETPETPLTKPSPPPTQAIVVPSTAPASNDPPPPATTTYDDEFDEDD